MFGLRKKPEAAPTPVVTVGDGKGKATPKRRESQAARKQPLVPTGRTAPGRGASKETKAAARAERVRARELMMAGDERYLQPRDQGPVRRLARDTVDSRFNAGEVLLPVMLVVVILSVSGLSRQAPQVFTPIFFAVYALVIGAAVDALLMTRRLKKRVAERFGASADTRGLTTYAAFRAFQLRRSRIPRPQVKRGERPA